jgi:hypothetical protein
MAGAVHKTGNVVLADTYAQKTALRLGVATDAVRAEFKKTPAAKTAPAPAADEPGESFEASTEMTRPSAHEFHLLKLLLQHEDLVGWAAMHLEPAWVQHAAVREIVSRRIAAQSAETWTSLAGFLDECDSQEMQNLITETVAESRALPNPEQQLADVTLRLRNQFVDRQIVALTHRASQPGTGDHERADLLREQQRLKQFKRQPLAPLPDSR